MEMHRYQRLVTLGVGNYTAIVQQYLVPTQLVISQLVAGACTATDASSEDLSNAPSSIVFDLTVALNPTPPNPLQLLRNPVMVLQERATGVYDCSANPLTTSPQRPDLEALGYTTRLNGGIDFSWRIHNYVYNQGPACTSGYCNGSNLSGSSNRHR